MIDCEKIAQQQKDMIREKVQYFVQIRSYPIKLAIIQVGDNPASNSYIRGKLRDCQEVGILGELYKFDENIDPVQVSKVITELNKDHTCRGIIIQLPLPAQFTPGWKNYLFNKIDYNKDVDGFRKDSTYIPCTPKGVMTILDFIDCTLKGKVCCVIGKSDLVGRPMVRLLLDKGATVISCNSSTKNLKQWTTQADVIISATGKQGLITKDMVSPDAIIIDVGITRNQEGKLCGDCDKELYDYVDKITPVPKGVGLMTRVSLLLNVIEGL